MITIVKAKIKNYRSIGDIELDIDGQGLVSVMGANLDDPLSPSNGVGKSTILSSLKWGLFGISSDGDKADDILSLTNPKDCSVEMTIIKDGQLAEIARYRKHKQHGNNVYFYIDKQPVNAAKNKDIQPLIDAYLGFDENIFSILLTMGGLSKNSEPFMYMNDSGRKEFTDFLLNLSYLGECLKEVKSDIDGMEKEVSSILDDTAKKTIIADSLRTKIQEYNEMAAKWQDAHILSIDCHKDAVAKTVKLLADAKEESVKLEELLKDATQKESDAYNKAVSVSIDESNKKRDVEEVEKSICSTQWEIENTTKKIGIVPDYEYDSNIISTEYDEELSKRIAERAALDKEHSVLNNKKANLQVSKMLFSNNISSETKEKINEIETQTTNLKMKISILQSEKKTIKKDHDEINEFLTTGNLKCPKCRQGVDKAHLTAELENLKQEHNIKVDEIKKCGDTMTVLQHDLETLNRVETQNNTKKYEDDIAELEIAISNTAIAFSTIDNAIKELHRKKSESTKTLQAEQKAKYIKVEQERVDKLYESIKELAAKKERLVADKVKADIAYSDVVNALKTYKESVKELSTKKLEAERANSNSKTAVINLESALKYHAKQFDDEKKAINPYTDLINKNVLMLNQQSDIIKDNNAKLATLRQDIEYLYFWRDGFNTAGLKSYILDSVTALLDTKANDCLSKLSSSLAIKFVTQDTLKSGDVRDKFDVNIYNNGNKMPFYRLSAGQRARVSFAVNYALKVLAEYYHNIKINFTFIDEALDNLDSVGIQQVIHTLKEQTKQYTSIFVVSHNDELKSLFDKTLVLIYENGVTRLDD